MKNFGRITLNETAQWLSNPEMQRIRGGDDPCPEGQYLYSCTLSVTWTDGSFWSGDNGVICSENAGNASMTAAQTAFDQINNGAIGYEEYTKLVESECFF